MYLIKKQIKYNKKDIVFPIQISSDENLGGAQQVLENFVEKEALLSINNVIDGETYSYLPESAVTLNFLFNISGNTYSNLYTDIGFTLDEITKRKSTILKSFYIFQVYDSFKTAKQRLLHTSYYNGYDFIRENSGTTVYNFDYFDEYTNLYIKNSFIEEINNEPVYLYVKIYFYNSKTGKLHVFYNQDNESLTTEEKMYFKILLNPQTFTYENSFNFNVKELNNTNYVNKTNNTLESFNNKKPTYPQATTFLNTGNYIE